VVTKTQRILAIVALIAGGTLTPLAIQQVAEANAIEAAQAQAELEDAVIDAAYALKELGRSPEQVRDELSRVSEVAPAILEDIANRATLAAVRDDRARRTVDTVVIVPSAAGVTATAAYATAMCEPLAIVSGLIDSHAACLASHTPLGGDQLCADLGTGVVVGAAAARTLTPHQHERVTAALTGSAEVLTTDGTERLRTLGWWRCGQSVSDDDDAPMLSGDPL
jgi:hypothetical protein